MIMTDVKIQCQHVSRSSNEQRFVVFLPLVQCCEGHHGKSQITIPINLHTHSELCDLSTSLSCMQDHLELDN